eukprot:4999020-Pleurochrysis_carterae.AAC.1
MLVARAHNVLRAQTSDAARAHACRPRLATVGNSHARVLACAGRRVHRLVCVARLWLLLRATVWLCD